MTYCTEAQYPGSPELRDGCPSTGLAIAMFSNACMWLMRSDVVMHGKSFAAVSFACVEQLSFFDALAFIVVTSPIATTTHSGPTSLNRCAMSPSPADELNRDLRCPVRTC